MALRAAYRETMGADAGFLEHLPGVGAGLAKKIRAAYGDDAGFRDACRDLDLDRLLGMEGLSERRAFELVAQVRQEGVPDLASTDRAREVRRELEELLAGYAQTSLGKRHVRLLPVLRDPESIRERAERTMRARDFAEKSDRPAIQRALSRVSRFREPGRISSLNRPILVSDDEAEIALRERGIDRWLRIVHARDAGRYARDADLVLDASTGDLPELSDAAHLVPVRGADPLWKLVPERDVQFVEANRATLEAMRELASLTDRESVAPQILDACASAQPSPLPDLFKAANEALREAQTALESSIGQLSLSGAQLLELVTKGGTPKALDGARAEAAKVGRARFREMTGLNFDPFEPGLPLKVDEQLLEESTDAQRARQRVEAFRRQQDAAKTIDALRPAADAELKAWIEFDVDYALGCFAADFDAHPAQTGTRLRFERAAHIRFKRRGDCQPIDYELGDPSVAVLTGANSGGKTSLLELVTQLVLLHHWGLPVPAQRAEIPLLQELLCVAPVRGADAGAFETFLRELFPPLTRPGRKLLLLDEVENITELEAAGKILGVFLDEVARANHLCILVTHLPGEVLSRTRARVRIDGIDAVGLDEKFNLIVDRQPRLNHRARSTPEFILRRVHSKSSGAVKELYARILDGWAP